jgi:hypothetical protein
MKILPLVGLVILLVGCDARMGHDQVQRMFPTSDIKNVPGSATTYIIKTPDGTIVYASANGCSVVVTNLLFLAPEK